MHDDEGAIHTVYRKRRNNVGTECAAQLVRDCCCCCTRVRYFEPTPACCAAGGSAAAAPPPVAALPGSSCAPGRPAAGVSAPCCAHLQSMKEDERRSLTPLQLREKAAQFALKTVDAQREQFKRCVQSGRGAARGQQRTRKGREGGLCRRSREGVAARAGMPRSLAACGRPLAHACRACYSPTWVHPHGTPPAPSLLAGA